MPGPKPKPTNIKKLEGNPGKRKLNAHEAQPAPVLLPCPKNLKGIAGEEWERIVPELHVLGLLAKIDHAALESYCVWYERAVGIDSRIARAQRRFAKASRKKRQDLHTDGIIRLTSNGNAILEPLFSASKQAWEMVHKFCTEFGMSPAARTRIAIKEQDGPEDPMEKAIRANRNN